MDVNCIATTEEGMGPKVILEFKRRHSESPANYSRADLDSIAREILGEICLAAHYRDTGQIQNLRDMLDALSNYLLARTGT